MKHLLPLLLCLALLSPACADEEVQVINSVKEFESAIRSTAPVVVVFTDGFPSGPSKRLETTLRAVIAESGTGGHEVFLVNARKLSALKKHLQGGYPTVRVFQGGGPTGVSFAGSQKAPFVKAFLQTLPKRIKAAAALERGVAQLKAARYAAAERAFTHGMKLDPTQSAFWSYRASAKLGLCNLRGALLDAIEYRKRFKYARARFRALVRALGRDVKNALKMLSWNPTDAENLVWKSRLGGAVDYKHAHLGEGTWARHLVEFTQGKSTEAQFLERVKSLKSHRPLALAAQVHIGLAAEQVGDRAKATRHYRAAVGMRGHGDQLEYLWAHVRLNDWGVATPTPKPTPHGKKTCAGCKSTLHANSKFCSQCGKKVGPPVCASCKTKLREGSKFCHQCGAKQ